MPQTATTMPSYSEGFENVQSLSQASLEGCVALSRSASYKGGASLWLSRAHEDMDSVPTSASLVSFPVCEGRWDLSVAMRSSLHSPDSSYNGTVRFVALDASGGTVASVELAVITGASDWRVFRKRVELTGDAVEGRFVVRMEKTWGEFHADEIAAVFAGPILRTVAAIKFATTAVGNLFLPADPVKFDLTVECLKPLTEENSRATCMVRDYWGVEISELCCVKLAAGGRTEKGRHVYTGNLDLSSFPVEVGKYYEVQAEIFEPELPEPTREGSTFAVLPEAVTKQHAPLEIPFTASGWNPGVPGFFPLCDRLGFRVANVYSSWSATPPYDCTAPGIEEVKALGMGALMRSMAHAVEGRRPGYEGYTETALREGARRMVEKYKDDVPIIVRNGNEPHPADDAQALEMIAAYKAVYDGVKEADPNIVVTSTSCGAEEQFFRLGFQRCYDVYDFHQYADADMIPDDFERYYQLVEKYGGRKPVWSTEIGQNSQGMSREAVAIQMIKIFANFFACGGKNASWFGIMWPDPDGSIVGSNGDSFDIFHSKYCLYSPKLTAVTEYHLINAICTKKVVESRKYEGKGSLTLFRDDRNRCLMIAWRDAGRRDLFLPLSGVGTVKLTHLDGSSCALDAKGSGLTLTLGGEPVLLEFESAELRLPEEFGTPCATLECTVGAIVKGGTVTVALCGDGVVPDGLELLVPPRWSVRREVGLDGQPVCCVTAPELTAAREGRLVARCRDGSGELVLPLAVIDPLEVRLVPSPFQENVAGMAFTVRNHGTRPRTLRWRMEFPERFAMSNGTFKLGDPTPFRPSWTGASEGEFVVGPGAQSGAVALADNLDPLGLYKAVLELECEGTTCSHERLFGGCAGVPRVEGGVVFDGKMGDSAWSRSPALKLDQDCQYAVLTRKTARREKPEDLSGTMRLLWDDQYLYIGMAVQDDVFCNPECDAAIWRGDGLQFLVDPCRDSTDKPGKYDYCLGLGTKGPQMWCGCTADPSKAPTVEVRDVRLKITPTGNRGDMVYEVAIPWHRLSPFKPEPGANLGLAMIVNDDDGRIRDSFIAWFGCAHSKQMSMNGDLILLGADGA